MRNTHTHTHVPWIVVKFWIHVHNAHILRSFFLFSFSFPSLEFLRILSTVIWTWLLEMDPMLLASGPHIIHLTYAYFAIYMQIEFFPFVFLLSISLDFLNLGWTTSIAKNIAKRKKNINFFRVHFVRICKAWCNITVAYWFVKAICSVHWRTTTKIYIYFGEFARVYSKGIVHIPINWISLSDIIYMEIPSGLLPWFILGIMLWSVYISHLNAFEQNKKTNFNSEWKFKHYECYKASASGSIISTIFWWE